MLHIQLHPPKWFYGLFLSIFAISAVAITTEINHAGPPTLAKRVESILDGVVKIAGEKDMADQFGVMQKGSVFGTGFFIGDNLILTNNHVVDGDTNTVITTRNGTRPYKIEIVIADKLSDVALVKIVDSDIEAFKRANKPVIFELESADDLVVGEIVYSIGHPWGFSWTVSQGIISGVDRRFPGDNGPQYYLQTDAKIFSGNSGGPLIDESGKVVGMNSQIYVNNGGSFGFAIPGELLKKIVNDLQTKKEVVWAILGVSIGVDSEGSVNVEALTPAKPAEGAGIKVGDTILSLTTNYGSSVRIREPADLLNMLAILNDKDQILLEIKRKDVIKKIPVVLDGKTSKEFL